ncbi:DUF551 domain-containing protein [Pasteurella multocida]|nr:DUF551 domain-containing protein [Pasteurella multocida]
MTETENKYFAINIYDRNSISFHDTEEEAKEKCLKCAENLYDLATENDNFSLYEKRLNNAVYGVILGKVETKTRELSEDEKRSINYFNCDYNVDAIIEKPEIVKFPQDNGWISVEDSLPTIGQQVIILIDNIPQIAFCDCEGWFAYNFEWVDGTEWNGTHVNIEQVTHWQPLSPPPRE